MVCWAHNSVRSSDSCLPSSSAVCRRFDGARNDEEKRGAVSFETVVCEEVWRRAQGVAFGCEGFEDVSGKRYIKRRTEIKTNREERGIKFQGRKCTRGNEKLSEELDIISNAR